MKPKRSVLWKAEYLFSLFLFTVIVELPGSSHYFFDNAPIKRSSVGKRA